MACAELPQAGYIHPPVFADGHSLHVTSSQCDANRIFAPHTHSTMQVMFSMDGVLTASTAGSEWRAPPRSMVWIPPDRQHSLAVARTCKVFSLHLSCEARDGPDDCSVSPVSALVVELVAYLAQPARAHDLARQACLKEVIREELQRADSAACRMQLPLDRRAARVAQAILAEPADPRTLHEWAREVGACERTLSRVFERQTGLTFKKWQQRSRLIRSVEHLRQGMPVTEVAMTVGYDSVSAFISIFRKEYGVTPGTYVAVPRAATSAPSPPSHRHAHG